MWPALPTDCGFNQATPRPTDPIKRHGARRERRHLKATHTHIEQRAIDLLENGIRHSELLGLASNTSASAYCFHARALRFVLHFEHFGWSSTSYADAGAKSARKICAVLRQHPLRRLRLLRQRGVPPLVQSPAAPKYATYERFKLCFIVNRNQPHPKRAESGSGGLGQPI